MPDMGAMLQNPAMMDMMQAMMKNISPEQLVAMSRMSGRELTPEQARPRPSHAPAPMPVARACTCAGSRACCPPRARLLSGARSLRQP